MLDNYHQVIFAVVLSCQSKNREQLDTQQVSLAFTMFFSLIYLFILAMFLLLTNTCAIRIVHREPCAENFTPCAPPGATNSIVPPVSDALSGLYFDLVGSTNPQPVIRDTAADQAPSQARDTRSTICCEWQDQ